MQASEKLYDKIASYLLGELEGEALKEFESSLMSDAELRKEVELHRQVSIHLSNAQEQDFKSNLANIRKSRFGTNQGVKRKSNTFKWIGIGFLLSALIYFAQIFLFDSTSNEKLLPEKQEQELQNSKTEEVGAESKVIDDNPAVNVSDKTTSAKSDIQNEPKKQRPILIEKEKENEKSDSQIFGDV